MLNRKTREQLVMLVHSGKNTYADIKQALPDLTDSDLRIASLPMMINDPSERVLCLDHHSFDDLYHYQFAENDTFSLSWYGEDLLYYVQKELRQEDLASRALAEAKLARYIAEKSLAIDTAALKEARSSKYYAMIAAAGTIAGILISLWLSG